MDLRQFYMEAGKIALFPGSVDDLNRIESASNSGKQYELMPVDGGRKYLTGAIIPSPTEIRELMKAQLSGISAFSESGLAAKMDMNPETISEFESQFGEASEMLEQLTKQMFGNPAIMGMDLRMKAREIGANGLVHVQLYNKEATYMGVPVKLQR
jgi:hypothetical protein